MIDNRILSATNTDYIVCGGGTVCADFFFFCSQRQTFRCLSRFICRSLGNTEKCRRILDTYLFCNYSSTTIDRGIMPQSRGRYIATICAGLARAHTHTHKHFSLLVFHSKNNLDNNLELRIDRIAFENLSSRYMENLVENKFQMEIPFAQCRSILEPYALCFSL